MRIIKVFQAFALGLALLVVVSCQNQPIHNVDNHPIPAAAQKLSMKEIEQAIIQAGSARHWRFERLGEDALRARQLHEKGHEAVVDITYSQTAYSIRLNTSSRLRERDGTIHPTYNLWVRNLEKDIEDRLHAAALKRP